jgi:hypothetical protein
MYCEWCGNQYLRQHKRHKSCCIPCAEIYDKFYSYRTMAKKPNATEATKKRYNELLKYYEDMALKGFKVPSCIKEIIR